MESFFKRLVFPATEERSADYMAVLFILLIIIGALFLADQAATARKKAAGFARARQRREARKQHEYAEVLCEALVETIATSPCEPLAPQARRWLADRRRTNALRRLSRTASRRRDPGPRRRIRMRNCLGRSSGDGDDPPAPLRAGISCRPTARPDREGRR